MKEKDVREKVVAWVSRHRPLPAQVFYLGERLHSVRMVCIDKTFRDANEVMEEVRKVGAKYAVVVLPLSMIAQLVPLAKKEGITLLWSQMVPPENHPGPADKCPGPGRCPVFDDGLDVWLPLHNTEYGRHLRFAGFFKIKEVKMVLEPF